MWDLGMGLSNVSREFVAYDRPGGTESQAISWHDPGVLYGQPVNTWRISQCSANGFLYAFENCQLHYTKGLGQGVAVI